MPITVFLSYASEDGDFAELVEQRLNAEGVRVWRDDGALHPGDDWKAGIDNAISEADVVVLILTPSAYASSYVTYEWAYALGRERRVIPILREESQTHPRLDDLQYLDFTNRRARPWDRLIGAVRGEEVAVDSVPDEYDIARDGVLEYLDSRGYRMVSFERIRRSIDPDYDDEFLDRLVSRYPDELRPARLKGGKPGVARRTP